MSAVQAPAEAPALEAESISKRFGPTRALIDVDVRLRAGQCLGLVGRNGAGKSTLVAILSGLLVPRRGEVRFDGHPAPRTSDVRAWRSRIATVFQHSMVVPGLTVTENVYLGEPRVKAGMIDWPTMRRRTAEIIDESGAEDRPPGTLRAAVRRPAPGGGDRPRAHHRLARAAARRADGGARAPGDRDPVRASARAHERGVAVLYISHHLEEVFEICDQITVLRDGAVVRSAAAPSCPRRTW